jgi:cysteine synthase A
MLRLCGAEVRLVPAAPYSDPGNYVRVSERLARTLAATSAKPVLWANQWDNPANWRAYYEGTGPELWRQTGGRIDGFVCAIGTGGTIAGVGRALKERNPAVTIAIADPEGAAMYAYVTAGTLTVEGQSIAEGIGQSRITANVAAAPIDEAFRIPDAEALPVLFDLLRREGLCLGLSSGINVAGAIRLARQLGPGHTVATVLCDGGQRYRAKIFNPAFLKTRGLPAPDWLDEPKAAEPDRAIAFHQPPVREGLAS